MSGPFAFEGMDLSLRGLPGQVPWWCHLKVQVPWWCRQKALRGQGPSCRKVLALARLERWLMVQVPWRPVAR